MNKLNDNNQQEINKNTERSNPLETIVSENLSNGKYKTPNGSIVKISGEYSGIVKVDFDWFEENACVDCVPEPYLENFNKNDWRLIWHCDICDGGNAKLELIS